MSRSECIVGAAQRSNLTSCIEADVTCQFLGTQGNNISIFWTNISDMLQGRGPKNDHMLIILIIHENTLHPALLQPFPSRFMES